MVLYQSQRAGLDIDYVDRRKGAEILDRQARKYLNMSGAEFARQYRAGTLDDPDRPEVIRVALLLPLAGDDDRGRKNP